MNVSIAAHASPSRAALWGVVLITPGVLFLVANILNEVGIGFLYALLDPLLFIFGSPVVILGGLGTALVWNALAIARLDVKWEPRRLVSTFTVEPRTPNIALILAGGLALATLFAYLAVENYALVNTHVG